MSSFCPPAIIGHIAQFPQIVGGFGRDMHGFAYAGKTPKLTKEQYAKRFAKYLKKYSAITPDTLLLPDADDHSRIADNCDEEIAWIRELCPKSEFVQTDYVDLPEFDAPNLRVKRGELAETANEYFAGQSFTMLKRAVGTDESTFKRTEAKTATNNFNGIAGRGGVFFISKGGLHEVACEKFAENDILITLLRSFRRTYTTNGERDGMMHGKSEFEYAYSFGTDDFAEIYRRAQKLGADVKYASTPVADGLGEADLAKAFLKAEGGCVVSAVKPSQDGSKIVVRAFNPNPENAAKCSLELAAPAAEITKCRIDETPLETLAKNAARVSFTVEPNKITTLLITPAK